MTNQLSGYAFNTLMVVGTSENSHPPAIFGRNSSSHGVSPCPNMLDPCNKPLYARHGRCRVELSISTRTISCHECVHADVAWLSVRCFDSCQSFRKQSLVLPISCQAPRCSMLLLAISSLQQALLIAAITSLESVKDANLVTGGSLHPV